MERVKNFLKGLGFIVYLLVLFYLVFDNALITSALNLPTYFIPSISFIGIIFVGYRYLALSYKANKLEYEFTSTVNHTFRTPLTRIMWFTKELEKDLPTNERLLFLQNIHNATSKVLEIVDLFVGIKNINDTAGYFFEAISIRDIVEKSIVKYREEINKKKITFQVSTFKDMPLLTVDLKKITFVIDSLIENAIFYTPVGGKVLIDSVARSNDMLIFVSDNGIGLSFRDKARVFSRFYRSKKAVLMNPDGMGMKLYLSKQIIKRHGGKIYAESDGVDKGTTFFIALPFANKLASKHK